MKQSWKRMIGQRVRHLTPQQARDILASIGDNDDKFMSSIKKIADGTDAEPTYVISRLAARAGLKDGA